MKMFRKDEGFTLVELMVVVLIIGILVAIAVPVFLNASANAQAKSCQANQRTIVGAVQTFNASLGAGQTEITSGTVATEPVLDGTSSTGNINQLVGASGSIKTAPVCPGSKLFYKLDGTLTVVGDKSGTTGWYNDSHKLGS